MSSLMAQTINELVQIWKNAVLAFFGVKKLCLQSLKSLGEVFFELSDFLHTQPFTPPRVMPLAKYFWKKGNTHSTGPAATMAMA